jgi:RNA polymerase sigma-70 factor (ECF subfamily)
MFSDEELNRFYRYCIALTGNDEDAFDLLQDCLEKFVRRGTDGIENEKGYFSRLIRNQFIDDSRRRVKRQATVPVSEALVIDIGLPSLEDIAIGHEDAERIMAMLDARDRELLFLWAVEGLTLQEIADHSDIPKGTLMSRIHRFRTRILNTLGADGKRVTRK